MAVAGGSNSAVVELGFHRREEALGHRVNAPILSIRAERGFVLVGEGFQNDENLQSLMST